MPALVSALGATVLRTEGRVSGANDFGCAECDKLCLYLARHTVLHGDDARVLKHSRATAVHSACEAEAVTV